MALILKEKKLRALIRSLRAEGEWIFTAPTGIGLGGALVFGSGASVPFVTEVLRASPVIHMNFCYILCSFISGYLLITCCEFEIHILLIYT